MPLFWHLRIQNPRRDVWLLLAFALFACGPDEEGSLFITVRDSAGIQIVETTGPQEEWTVDTVPFVAIGAALGGDSMRLFDDIKGAWVMDDSSVVVADGGSEQLRYFRFDGLHIASVGSRGGGPGEFRNLSQVVQAPDGTLVVRDAPGSRLTVIDRKGTILSTTPTLSHTWARLWNASLRAVLDDGSLLFAQALRARGGSAFFRDTLGVVVLDPDGLADTIARIPDQEKVPLGAGSVYGVPFSPSAAFASLGSTVITATGETYELTERDLSGRVVRIIRRRDVVLEDVTDDDYDRLSKTVRATGETVSEEVMAARRDLLGNSLQAVPNDRTMPVLNSIAVDALGCIWVRGYSRSWEIKQPSQWTVFSRFGRPLAEVSTPARLTVTDIGEDWIAGTVQDDFLIEYVRVFALTRGESFGPASCNEAPT